VPPLPHDRVAALLAEVPTWSAAGDHHLVRKVRVKDFAAALALVNRIGALAEEQKHHPDLAFGWGWVEVKVWTHKIGGLTESDFVLAAKIDRLST
jgi:4a-hydroxytetrahydrobiopterin dehydratase